MRERTKALSISTNLLWVLGCIICSFNTAPGQSGGAVQAENKSANSVFTAFVTVQDGELRDENGKLRFISFNIPCLHYNEDRMAFAETNPWSLPDEFEIGDALESVRQMGGQVVRIYTLSVGSKDDRPEIVRHITAPGQFDEEAFDALDRVLAIANQKGVRVIIPFIDNWKWWGGVPALTAFRNKQPDDFWTDEQLFEDYQGIVSYLLNRTNSITGIKYKDDKAVFAWETGNELSSPDAWTAKAAAFIKSLDSNHLVIDGTHSPVLKDGSLATLHVDLVTTHHYSKNTRETVEQIRQNAERARGKKVYFVGEFGFVPTDDVNQILKAVKDNNVAGALIWSLRFRCRDGGFYWHSEPYGGDLFKAYHWPGFDSGKPYDEAALLALLRQNAFEIRGMNVPSLPVPAAPKLLSITDNAFLSWQGSAGAQSYIVERSQKPNGPWKAIGKGISDADVQHRPLFSDPDAAIGKSYYYRIKAQNAAGVSQASNVAGPVYAVHQMLIDEMSGMKRMDDHGGSLSLENKEARKFKEDMHRLKGEKGAFIVYKTREPIRSFKLYSFFEESVSDCAISASANGKTYEPVQCEISNYFTGPQNYNYHVPVLYESWIAADKKYRYLRIEYTGPAQISRIEIKCGGRPSQFTCTKHPAGFVKAFSWGWTGWRGQYTGDKPAESMNLLAQTGADWVCIAFAAEMDVFDNPHFTFSDVNGRMVTDAEVRRAIQLARDNNMKVILKPVINVTDGTWRAWIKFNDAAGNKDMARWNIWWSNFRNFVVYYAMMAEETGCEMFCAGCEMESTEEFEIRWRDLLTEIRQVYGGAVTYNLNHDREEFIPWLDALDIISVSAYYGVGSDDASKALAEGLHNVPPESTSIESLKRRWQPIRERLEKVSRKFDRPMLFIEQGVGSCKGCSAAPWTHPDVPNLVYDADEQARFYQSAFETFWDEDWFMGFAWWDWPAHQYEPEKAATDISFNIYGKPAEEVLRQWYRKHR